MCLLVSSADNLCKQFGPRSGSTLDPICLTLRWHSKKLILKEKSADDKNMKNFPGGQQVKEYF